MKKYLLLLIGVFALLSSCSEDSVDPEIPVPTALGTYQGTVNIIAYYTDDPTDKEILTENVSWTINQRDGWYYMKTFNSGGEIDQEFNLGDAASTTPRISGSFTKEFDEITTVKYEPNITTKWNGSKWVMDIDSKYTITTRWPEGTEVLIFEISGKLIK
jgi:hypothetical protein